MIVLARFYLVHCILGHLHSSSLVFIKIPAMMWSWKWCTVEVMKLCTTHQIFVLARHRLYQWSSSSSNKLLKPMNYLMLVRLLWNKISCMGRCHIQFPSHDAPQSFWLLHFNLDVSIQTSLKVRLFSCCLMDINNTTTLSLMQPQNACMGNVSQRHFFLGLMLIYYKCLGAKHTFVQKGEYHDMRSSVVISLTWRLVTVRIS